MALMTPPPRPPRVALGEDDGLRRVRLRLWQINASAITVFLATWCWTLGPIPAIVAVMVAKHVLVAIVVVGLGVNAPVDALERPDGLASPPIDWR
jgi:hypothetical protein